MDLGIKGKRALVGGGSSGIGKATAELLLKEGVEVCIVGRDEQKLLDAVRDLASLGRVVPITADLATSEGVDQAWAAAERHLEHVDILVNNAGGPKSGPFESLSDDDWRAAFELNLMGTVRMTRHAVKGMAERRWGRVVNVTSTSVKQPVDNLMLSNSLRMAVVGFAKTLGNELPGVGITLNTVAPGFASTERLGTLAKAAADRQEVSTETIMERWSTDVPLRRIGTPHEVAAAIVFLASEPAAYINGVVLAVDGGRTKASL